MNRNKPRRITKVGGSRSPHSPRSLRIKSTLDYCRILVFVKGGPTLLADRRYSFIGSSTTNRLPEGRVMVKKKR